MKAASSDGLTEEPVHGFSALSVLPCSIDCLCRAECIARGNRIFNWRRQRALRITGRSLTIRGVTLLSYFPENVKPHPPTRSLSSHLELQHRRTFAHCPLRTAHRALPTRHQAPGTTHYALRTTQCGEMCFAAAEAPYCEPSVRHSLIFCC